MNEMNLFALTPCSPGTCYPAGQAKSGAERAAIVSPELPTLEYRFEVPEFEALIVDNAYFATVKLAEALVKVGMTGVQFTSARTSLSENILATCPTLEVPEYRELIPRGTAIIRGTNDVEQYSGHDICLGRYADYAKPTMDQIRNGLRGVLPPYALVVTVRCLKIMRQFAMETCSVVRLHRPQTA